MTERSTVEILKAARKRIEDPGRWIKGLLADTLDSGSNIEAIREGSCWCASGAIACESNTQRQWFAATDLLEATIDASITVFNDRATHADVLAAFDRAIQAAEQSPSNPRVAEAAGNGERS